MENDKIKFKPLHEGMGFHPFSDGLPYAPESKNKFTTGAGATSAGRPQFANPAPSTNAQPAAKATARQIQERQQNAPLSQMPITHSPIRESVQSKNKTQVANSSKNVGLGKTVGATAAPSAKTSATTVVTASLLRRRAFAYLMDTVIHAGFWLGTNLTALFLFKFQLDSEILRDNFGQFLLFFVVSQWMFIALQEILFENSIGKVFFNLEFKRNHRSLFVRSFIFMVGLLFFGLGLYFRPQDRLGEIQLKSKLYADA